MRFLPKLILFVLILALSSAACSSGGANADPQIIPTAQPQAVIPTQVLPVNSAGVPLMAKVNGVEITQTQFERALARRQLEVNAADPLALASDVLDTLIEQLLIEQAAASLSVTVTESEVETGIQALRAEAGSDEAWQQWLVQNLYTEDEVRSSQRNSMITQKVVGAVTGSIPDTVRVVHARHILVINESEAKDLLARIQSGEEFGALAAQFSKDSSTATTGGDLGWFGQDELLEPVLAQVAFSLLPGQVAGPIGTRLGYHVIQTLEFADQPVTAEKRAALIPLQFENWLQSLLDSASIERYGGF